MTVEVDAGAIPHPGRGVQVAVNTWAGPAAQPAADDDARLLAGSLEYRQRDALREAAAAIATLGEVTWVDGSGHWVVDPSGTKLRLALGCDG